MAPGTLIKVAAASVLGGLGVQTARSIKNVTNNVKVVRVPKTSMLHKFANTGGKVSYVDAYEVRLPEEMTAPDINSTMKAFFTCPVFSRLEKPLLKTVGFKERGLTTGRFSMGEPVLAWKVYKKSETEALLTWGVSSAGGATWFQVSPIDRTLTFGSSVTMEERGRDEITAEDDLSASNEAAVKMTSKSTILRIFGNLEQPEQPSMVQSVKRFLGQAILNLSLPVHKLYSRYLLLSTLKQLERDLKKNDGS